MIYYDVKNYGAKGDLSKLDTAAIQEAINDCAKAGGGRVYIPNGSYLISTLELLDGVILYLENGAILKASPELSDYPHLPLRFKERDICRSLIYAIGRKHIGIEGRGIIDFSDEAFIDLESVFESEQVPISELDEKQLAESTTVFKERLSQPLSFTDCDNVHIKNVTLWHSPFWSITFHRGNHIFISGITIDNRLNVPNSDGINFVECQNVTMTDCQISGGDDCVAVYGKQIVITNCTFRSRSSGIRIGYSTTGAEDVLISNIAIYDSNRGIIIQAMDTAKINNVMINNVVMHTKIPAGIWWGKGQPLTISALSGDGEIRNIIVSNVIAHSENGITICGNENGNVSDILLRDWMMIIYESPNRRFAPFIDIVDEATFPLAKGDVPWHYCKNVQNLSFVNVSVRKDKSAADINITPFTENTEIAER